VVFVTVGNAKNGFLRLLDAVEALAEQGLFREAAPIVIQVGNNSDFRSRHCETVPFLPIDEFRRVLAKADLVICHGGSTVMSAIALNKVPVVMPRRRQYMEAVNDHQKSFVEALAAEGLVVPAYEPSELGVAIAEAMRRRQKLPPTDGPQLGELVSKAIAELVGDIARGANRDTGECRLE
jgi:UDP-N-acetylglucosamine transferase subunit ALG13